MISHKRLSYCQQFINRRVIFCGRDAPIAPYVTCERTWLTLIDGESTALNLKCATPALVLVPHVEETWQFYMFKERNPWRSHLSDKQISTQRKYRDLHMHTVLRMQRGLFWHKSTSHLAPFACSTIPLKWTLIRPSRQAGMRRTAAGSFPHWHNALPTLMKLLHDHIQQSVHGKEW